MKIEVVEFYHDETLTKQKLKHGTMHIYIIDLQIDIRGIRWFKTKKKWIMRMPHLIGIEDGKRVFYPVVTFTDTEKMNELLTEIKTKGLAYILEKFK